MIPLIYFEAKEKLDNFEATRVRKSLKSALEVNNEVYVTSLSNKSYDLIHFVSLKDYKKKRRKINKNAKKVISILSCEEDILGKTLSFKGAGKNKKAVISKRNKKYLKEFDCILVPSLEAKEFLIRNDVRSRIEPFLIPLRKEKFNLDGTYLDKAIYSYLKINKDRKLVVTTIAEKDFKAFKRLDYLAEKFPELYFVVICHKNFFLFDTIRLQNVLDVKRKNILLTRPLHDEIYYSLLHNALIFLNLSSFFGNDQEMLEAMASHTQIFGISSSSFKDIAVDKQNSYLYNDLESLKEGISLYLKDLLASTCEEGYKFVDQADVKLEGQKLIKIYKDLLGE